METASHNVTFGTFTCIFLSVKKKFSLAREGASNDCSLICCSTGPKELLCNETSSCLMWVL